MRRSLFQRCLLGALPIGALTLGGLSACSDGDEVASSRVPKIGASQRLLVSEIGTLLDTCPQRDPAYDQIRADFEIRRDGVVVDDIPCTEPIAELPIEQYTDELILVQALRTVLHMDLGDETLPWAPGLRLYDWMKSYGAVFNFDSTASNNACCTIVDGKPWVRLVQADETQRNFDREWPSIGSNISLLAHELRHIDGPGHVGCCPQGAGACDQTYDESNLGSYGVNYWLESRWLTGELYTGFSCLGPEAVSNAAGWHQLSANGTLDRFCDVAPPAVSIPPNPGGDCRSQPGIVDLFFVLDTSGSFADDLAVFKAEAQAIIERLVDSGVDLQVGLATFEDYPIPPFGRPDMNDVAYRRVMDLSSDHAAVLTAIQNVPTPISGAGGDEPQSQLAALYQAASGAGEDLSSTPFPDASIPAGQNASFRDGATKRVLLWTDQSFHSPGDPGDIPYPGPTFDETVAALFAVDPAEVIGIASGSAGYADLLLIAEASGSLAPADGVDCDGDGSTDVAGGEPLVCMIGDTGQGAGEAIASLVEGGVKADSPIAVCKDVVVDAAPGACGAQASIDDGSYDQDGTTVSLVQAPPGPYPAGTNVVTLTAVDASGLTDQCTATVTVVGTTAPEFSAVPASLTTTDCTPDLGMAVASDSCLGQASISNDAPAVFPPGETLVTWTAEDTSGNITTATQRVTVKLGDDPSCCPAGSNVIIGTSNNDTLIGTEGSDCILGLGAQDTIDGRGGDDFISAGDGNDNVSGGSGNDVVFAGSGQDQVNGGNGDDWLDAGAGDDICHGNGGNDSVFGGQGQDQLHGDAGDDALFGEEGDDSLFGGDDADSLVGGGLHDQCSGGAGDDSFASCENQPDSCVNGSEDGTETDVDCGGACGGCLEEGLCHSGDDCAAGLMCVNDSCQGELDEIAASLSVTGDWGGGYCANLTIHNQVDEPLTWSVEIDLGASTLSNSWEGNFSSSTGSSVVTPLESDATLDPAGSTSVGFCALRSAPGVMPSVVSTSASAP